MLFFSVQNACSGVDRSENVGRRLASQQSLKNRIESVKTGLLFSPDIDERLTKKGTFNGIVGVSPQKTSVVVF